MRQLQWGVIMYIILLKWHLSQAMLRVCVSSYTVEGCEVPNTGVVGQTIGLHLVYTCGRDAVKIHLW